jgi:hypothetical protein
MTSFLAMRQRDTRAVTAVTMIHRYTVKKR